jgi:hypothetical protein
MSVCCAASAPHAAAGGVGFRAGSQLAGRPTKSLFWGTGVGVPPRAGRRFESVRQVVGKLPLARRRRLLLAEHCRSYASALHKPAACVLVAGDHCHVAGGQFIARNRLVGGWDCGKGATRRAARSRNQLSELGRAPAATVRYNMSVNTDALRRPAAARPACASRRLPSR